MVTSGIELSHVSHSKGPVCINTRIQVCTRSRVKVTRLLLNILVLGNIRKGACWGQSSQLDSAPVL